MRYTVIWRAVTRRDLTRIWMLAPDPQAVSIAANRIDRTLRVDPDRKGQWFFGDWLLIDPPLAVVYTIRPDDRMVEVTEVWHRQ